MTIATAIERQPIYTTPSGFKVYEFSHSQFSTYKECPKKFYFERIVGWKRKPGGAMEMGHAIQAAVQGLYQKEPLDPVETFEKIWELQRQNEGLKWPKGESWETMRVAGIGLMTTFKRDWKNFPPRNPVFFEYKDRLLIRDAGTKNDYATIPDLIDKDERGDFMIDVKCLGKMLPEKLPGQVALDGQLCTQAAAVGIYRVGLWNFCRQPKRPDPLPASVYFDQVRAAIGGVRYQQLNHVTLYVLRSVEGMSIPEAGLALSIENANDVAKEWNKIKKSEPELLAIADDLVKSLSLRCAPVWKIQWIEETISKEHAFAAVRDEMSVVPLIQAEYFPRRGGIRFPDDHCGYCPYRGLCLEDLLGSKPEYDEITRDELVRIDGQALDF